MCFEPLDFVLGHNIVRVKENSNAAEINYTVRRSKDTCIYFGKRFFKKDLTVIYYQYVLFPVVKV